MKKLTFTVCWLLLAGICFSQTYQTGTTYINGEIDAMVRSGDFIYIGGMFTTVDSTHINYLARLYAANGQLDSTWNPDIDGNVESLIVQNGKLVAGGYFSHADGQARSHIAIFDTATGALNSMTPYSSLPVYSICGDGVSNIYYTTSYPPSQQAFYDVVVPYNLLTGDSVSWESTILFAENDAIYSLAISGNWLYMGGNDIQGVFVNGAHDFRFYNLLRVNLATGVYDSTWQHPYVANTWVSDIYPYNGNILVVGSFDEIDSLTRNGNIEYDASGAVLPFQIYTLGSGDQNNVITGQYGTLWIGGNQPWYGGQRYRIAQVDATTGNATCWNATPTSQEESEVHAIVVSGDTVYLGGGGPCCGASTFQMYVGNPSPITPGIFGPATVALDSMVTFYGVSHAGSDYTWTINGNLFEGATDTISTFFTQLGYDTISMSEVNNQCGGGTVYTVIDVVTNLPSSVKNPDANNISIQNLTSGDIVVHASANYAAQTNVQIYNMLGQLVSTESIWLQNSTHLNITNLASGMYIIRFANQYGVLAVQVVKQ